MDSLATVEPAACLSNQKLVFLTITNISTCFRGRKHNSSIFGTDTTPSSLPKQNIQLFGMHPLLLPSALTSLLLFLDTQFINLLLQIKHWDSF